MIARLRSGRGRHRRRRHDVELLVQPADGAVLPRRDRRQVSVLDLRRAAGQRRGGDAHAHGLSARSRSATGTRSPPAARAITSFPDPHGSRHRLGRQGRALRLAHAPGSETSIPRSPTRTSTGGVDASARDLAARNPKAIYFGRQFVFKSVDAGRHWVKASPDLTRENPAVPGTSTR